MQFQQYDLGSRNRGEIVEVTLSGNAANVQLIDSSNLSNYKAGRRYTYFGGHATHSPIRIPIPSSGHWYIVIDLGGYAGTIRSAIRVLPGALPQIRETPLSSVPSLVQSNRPPSGFAPESDEHREYDVFISHASEDKDEIVRPLAYALQNKELEVWFDEFELKIGDSLRRKIDKGLANSRFGVVVLSQAFFNKGWTNYELDGMVTKSNTGEQIILPIWHKISKKEVLQYSPSLADKVARNTSTHTIEEIASEIAEVIQEV